jgi:hypothetical protein
MEAIKRINNKTPINNFYVWSWLFAFALFLLFAVSFHGLYSAFVAIVAGVGLITLVHCFRLGGFGRLPSVQVAFLSFIGMSFVPPLFQQSMVLVLVFSGLVWIYVRRHEVKKIATCDWKLFTALAPHDALVWQTFLVLIPILGVNTEIGFSAFDNFHPIYELSIGRSYESALLGAPDLSHVGREMRFHFLSTRVSLFVSNVGGVDVISATYLVVNFVALIASLLVLTAVMKNLTLIVPLFFLFLFPLSGSHGFYLPAVPFSYAAAFIISGPIVVYLARRQHVWLGISTIPLVLVKISYFLTFSGGILIFLLIKREWRRLYVYALLFLFIFGIAYFAFLSGAHGHNLWIVFPSYVFDLIFQHRVVFPLITAFYVFAIFLVFIRNKNDDSLHAAGAITLSGLIGVTVLTEVAEGNSRQFLIAAVLPTSICLWYLLRTISLNISGIRRNLLWIVVAGVIVFVGVPYGLDFGKHVVRVSLANSEMARSAYLRIRPERGLPPRLIAASRDFIEVYEWMGDELPVDSVVLFGKHYSLWDAKRRWWPDDGFFRSAFSGVQFYSENFKYKGVAMEADYSSRLAETIHIYRHYVLSSRKSKELLDQFYTLDFGFETALPLSEQTGILPFLKHRLSGGREWYWNNRKVQVYNETKIELRKLSKKNELDWLKHFLTEKKITHLVMENGDTPSQMLNKISRLIHQQGQLSVLEIKID